MVKTTLATRSPCTMFLKSLEDIVESRGAKHRQPTRHLRDTPLIGALIHFSLCLASDEVNQLSKVFF